jgi:Holliday junction resolvase
MIKKIKKRRISNPKAKGIKKENDSKKRLEDIGYAVTRSAASEGVFDLIAINEIDILLIQVKSGRKPTKEEMEKIRNFKCPNSCTKLLHIWYGDILKVYDVRDEVF